MKDYSWIIINRFRLRQAILFWLHTRGKTSIAHAFVLAGLALHHLGIRRRGLLWILKGRRAAQVPYAASAVHGPLRKGFASKKEVIGLLDSSAQLKSTDFVGRVLILKTPSILDGKVIEKGAIILKFSETLSPLYQLLDNRLLSKYFRIILEPSSVGYSSPELLVWQSLDPEHVIVLASYEDDFMFLNEICSNLIPVALGPADWVNPLTFFQRQDIAKIYDCIYVANFNPIKRVDRFVRAVARVCSNHPDYRAALVCASHGNAQREVMETLKWAADKADISYFPGVNQAGLNTLFNQAKVNVLLSLREGANKGLAEGLFAGTPALLIAECVCGNRRHITPETGLISRDGDLEETLVWFSDHYRQFDPRKWAELNISPLASTRVLSEALRELELTEGRIWTHDLLPKVNQPELGYLNDSDNWLLAERTTLLEVFSKGADPTVAHRFVQHLGEARP
jgi:glycosyltransferase involved in cell wall biosynthesis